MQQLQKNSIKLHGDNEESHMGHLRSGSKVVKLEIELHAQNSVSFSKPNSEIVDFLFPK